MQSLRLFHDIARLHSFSAAAAVHGITQSAASQRISQLERKLGVQLIDRSVRPLGLTRAGEIFAAGCEDLITRYDRLQRAVTEVDSRPVGLVRVAAIYSAGIELLNDLAERFEQKHDGVTVEIVYDHPDEVHHKVTNKECDFGIVSYPQRWRRVSVVPLRDELMVVAFRPGHELSGNGPVRASDLNDHTMICFDAHLPAGRRIRQYLKDNDVSPTIRNSFDNLDTMKEAVQATDHVAILPRRTVAREVKAGLLAWAPLEPKLVRPVGVILRGSSKMCRPLGPAARAFVDFLCLHAGDDKDPVLSAPHHSMEEGASGI